MRIKFFLVNIFNGNFFYNKLIKIGIFNNTLKVYINNYDLLKLFRANNVMTLEGDNAAPFIKDLKLNTHIQFDC